MRNPISKIWMGTPFFATALGWNMLQNGWMAVLLFHGFMLLALVIHRKEWEPKNLLCGGSIWWMIPILALMVCFSLWFYQRRDVYGDSLSEGLVAYGLHGTWVPILAVYFCLINPIIEEAFWRGLFATRDRIPTISDIAYGSFHILILIPFVNARLAVIVGVCLILVGYIWRQISVHSGGQRIAILWHGLGDLSIIGIFAWVAGQK